RTSPRVRLALAVALPVLFLAYVAYAAPEWVSFSEFAQGARAEHAVSCGLVGLLFGAMVSGGVLLLWRGTDPLTPGLTGALLGLVGGVGGGLAIGIACPSQEGWHACVSHGLGVLVFVGFGWAVGRRLLTP
ncbi:MAG TPA: NrsF family protein, partial [Polyangiaceae bacterium]